MEFYHELTPTFHQLPIFWKGLIVIGFVTIITFLVLLVVIISLMSETKLKTSEPDLEEFDDFLKEFNNGDTSQEKLINIEYPELPKIKDLQGNTLLNLLQIEIV
jgi:Na+-transporting methylmalonyl-CoA/oxaloacetate decarboxylase gamma subunit